MANGLFKAVDGEIELNLRDGVAYLEVRRAARTLRQAIVKTIREAETVEDVRVVRVESEAANTIAAGKSGVNNDGSITSALVMPVGNKSGETSSVLEVFAK